MKCKRKVLPHLEHPHSSSQHIQSSKPSIHVNKERFSSYKMVDSTHNDPRNSNVQSAAFRLLAFARPVICGALRQPYPPPVTPTEPPRTERVNYPRLSPSTLPNSLGSHPVNMLLPPRPQSRGREGYNRRQITAESPLSNTGRLLVAIRGLER